MRRKTQAMRLIRLLTITVLLAALSAVAQPSSRWAQPAAGLADQIAALLGPGQVHLSLRNLSTIPADQLPIIQRLIEQDLKTHGITASGDESANALRITLSENARERLWIAEVIEGKETQLAMVRADRDPAQPIAPAAGLTLRRQLLAILPGPVLDALEIPGGLITLTPEAIVIYARSDDGWREQSRLRIGLRRALPRDPRGMLVATSGAGFEAWLPGAWCAGTHAITPSSTGWTINCHESDDPWPILENSAAIGAPTLKAFYNAGRNYFTGVVTPNLPVDLPAFYSAAIIPRAAGGAAMLINGIDSKVQLLDNGALKTVVGTRDWGSDFAALSSGCGSGTQIIASGSGEALGDSLRAYEIPSLEAVAVSAPLAVNGAITALSASPDSKSLLAIVQTATNQYEEYRVTATCN